MRQEAIWGTQRHTINNIKGGKINEELGHVHTKYDVTKHEKKNCLHQKIRKTTHANSFDARFSQFSVAISDLEIKSKHLDEFFKDKNIPLERFESISEVLCQFHYKQQSHQPLRFSGCIAFMTSTGPTDIVKNSVPAVLLWDQLTVLAVVTDRRWRNLSLH